MTGLSSFIGLLLQQRAKEFVWRGTDKMVVNGVERIGFLKCFLRSSCQDSTCAAVRVHREPRQWLYSYYRSVSALWCARFFLSAFLLASLVQPLCPLTCHSVLIVELDICLSSRGPLSLTRDTAVVAVGAVSSGAQRWSPFIMNM